MPDAIGAHVDAVMAMDRAWFECHPGELSYQRDYIAREFWPLRHPIATIVTVRYFGKDMRTRNADTEPLNPEAVWPRKAEGD